MMLLPDDCTIRLIDLPISVGGRISECPDGHVDIYINSRLSQPGQLRATEHELEHLANDDLHNDRDIEEVERHGKKQLPSLVRARDLPRPAPKRAPQAVVPEPDPDPAPVAAIVIPIERSWAQDIFHRLPWLD